MLNWYILGKSQSKRMICCITKTIGVNFRTLEGK